MPDRPAIDRPLPSSFDDNDDFYNENGFQKVVRKLKQEPLIPLGCVLTVAAFTNAYRAMKRGDHARVNRMFRYRVLAQGFTIVAIVGGGMYYSAERHKERQMWQEKRDQDAEEKRQKWIRELEARDEEDRLVREKLEKRRQRVAAAGKTADGKAGGGTPLAVTPLSADATTPESKSSGSWLSLGGWFGGGGSSTTKPNDAPATPPPQQKPE